MAELIGISSGIAGLLSLAALVLGQCYQYGCAVADAPHEAKRLAAELATLSGVLVGIQGIGTSVAGPLPGLDLQYVLKGCEQALQQISNQLRAVTANASHTSIKRNFNRLAWPLRRTETLELIAAVERQKNTLSLALETLTVQLTVGQGTALRNVESLLEDTKAEMERSQLSEWKKQTLRWLSDHDFHAKHSRASVMRNSKTCRWLLKTPQFRNFLDSRSSCLWLYGIPGSGKTTLASGVIDDFLTKPSLEDSILAYFYCDASDGDSQRPEVVVGSLLCQICSQLPSIPSGINAAFANATSASGVPKKATPEELQRMMVMALRESRKAFVVVDGLDEAIRREELCEFLASLPLEQDCATHVFVTSRPEPDIRRVFEGMPSISAQCEAADDDIDEYITARIAASARLRKMSGNLQQHVHRSLKQGAQGMFRWVQCQMDEISKLRTEKAVKDALGMLPQSLYDTYARILSRVAPSDIIIARRALFWLTWALVPLSPSELAEAAIFSPGNGVVELDTRLTEPLDILEICGSLVMHDGNLDEVRLAHHSVRDYLSAHLSDQIPSAFQSPDRNAHFDLAKTCLAYLQLQDFSSGWCDLKELDHRCNQYPLLTYAAKFWPSHVRRSTAEAELLPFILRFMKPSRTPHFAFWLQVVLYDAHGLRLFSMPRMRWRAQPLYYAASYGLTATVQALLDAGAEINEKAGRYRGTALHAACYRDHEDIVRILLEAGADGRIRDDNGDAPGDFCIWRGDESMLSLLEAKGQMARRTSFSDKSHMTQQLHSTFQIEST